MRAFKMTVFDARGHGVELIVMVDGRASDAIEAVAAIAPNAEIRASEIWDDDRCSLCDRPFNFCPTEAHNNNAV